MVSVYYQLSPLICRHLETCVFVLRYTRSEEDLLQYQSSSEGSPKPEFSVYGSNEYVDDAECWSQEDDDIMQVSTLVTGR